MKTYLAHGFHREDSAMHVCMVVQIPDEDFVRVSLASVAESYAPQFCFHWFESIDGAGIPDDFRQKVYTEAELRDGAVPTSGSPRSAARRS
jgi:hypothetical protein